jgi:hypothetical protein
MGVNSLNPVQPGGLKLYSWLCIGTKKSQFLGAAVPTWLGQMQSLLRCWFLPSFLLALTLRVPTARAAELVPGNLLVSINDPFAAPTRSVAQYTPSGQLVQVLADVPRSIGSNYVPYIRDVQMGPDVLCLNPPEIVDFWDYNRA